MKINAKNDRYKFYQYDDDVVTGLYLTVDVEKIKSNFEKFSIDLAELNTINDIDYHLINLSGFSILTINTEEYGLTQWKIQKVFDTKSFKETYENEVPDNLMFLILGIREIIEYKEPNL